VGWGGWKEEKGRGRVIRFMIFLFIPFLDSIKPVRFAPVQSV
jgi:hypothetical protein